MKKLFYVLLISIFCMGIVSCANTYTKIIKSKTINTVFDEISEASGSTLVDSTVEESSIKDSTITKSKILDNSKIMNKSIIINSTIENSTISNSEITNQTITNQIITNSKIEGPTKEEEAAKEEWFQSFSSISTKFFGEKTVKSLETVQPDNCTSESLDALTFSEEWGFGDSKSRFITSEILLLMQDLSELPAIHYPLLIPP